jgi:hypothetical protein
VQPSKPLTVLLTIPSNKLSCFKAFVLALSYKQMELYHALPFFFYLLGLCVRKEPNWLSAFVNLAKIGLVVIGTFGLIWWPFFPQIEQVLTRIFPLNRGLFEDKGGFQLEFVSISRVINHLTCYKFECSYWWKIYPKKNPLQDMLSSLNAVISTNESTQIITGHVI